MILPVGGEHVPRKFSGSIASILRWILVLMVIAGVVGCCAQEPDFTQEDARVAANVRKIDIYFRHLGWGSSEEHLSISSVNGKLSSRFTSFSHYMGDGEKRSSSEGAVVSTSDIAILLHAIVQGPVEKERGLNKLSEVILTRNINTQPSLYTSASKACHEIVAKEYKRRLGGRRWIRPALEEYYTVSWTDDYAHLRAVIEYSDGSRTELLADAQQSMMLPLTTDGVVTWNYKLAEALANLLPKESMAFARLTPENLGQEVADRMLSGIWRRERARPTLCVGLPK